MYPTRYLSDSMPMGKTISVQCCLISSRYIRDVGPMMARYRFADWDISCRKEREIMSFADCKSQTSSLIRSNSPLLHCFVFPKIYRLFI